MKLHKRLAPILVATMICTQAPIVFANTEITGENLTDTLTVTDSANYYNDYIQAMSEIENRADLKSMDTCWTSGIQKSAIPSYRFQIRAEDGTALLTSLGSYKILDKDKKVVKSETLSGSSMEVQRFISLQDGGYLVVARVDGASTITLIKYNSEFVKVSEKIVTVSYLRAIGTAYGNTLIVSSKVSSSNDTGVITAIDITTGNVLWKTTTTLDSYTVNRFLYDGYRDGNYYYGYYLDSGSKTTKNSATKMKLNMNNGAVSYETFKDCVDVVPGLSKDIIPIEKSDLVIVTSLDRDNSNNMRVSLLNKNLEQKATYEIGTQDSSTHILYDTFVADDGSVHILYDGSVFIGVDSDLTSLLYSYEGSSSYKSYIIKKYEEGKLYLSDSNYDIVVSGDSSLLDAEGTLVDNRWEYHFEDGGLVVTKLDTLPLTLVKYNHKAITKITIEDTTATVLKGNLFQDLINLKSVDLANIESIGQLAFKGCFKLTTVLGDKLTTIGYRGFSSCSSLTEINLSNVTSIDDEGLYFCRSLNNVNLDNLKTVGASGMAYCTSLTTLRLPNLESMGKQAFYNASSLTSVSFGKLKQISDSAFYYATSLTDIDCTNVENIGTYAFQKATALTKVELPDSVLSIDSYAFGEDTALTEVDLPSSLVSIGSYAFKNCSKLNTIINRSKYPQTISSYAFPTNIGQKDAYGFDSNTTFKTAISSAGYLWNGEPTVKDITKPEITKHVSTYDDVFNEVNITLKATDDTTEASKLMYRLGDNGQWQSSKEFTVDANGNYNFYVKDEAGNISEPYKVTVNEIPVVDNETPVITSADKVYNEESNTVTVTVNATDNIGVTDYSFDGGKTWDSVNNKEFDTNQTLQIYVRDAKGNKSAVTELQIIEIKVEKALESIELADTESVKKVYKVGEAYEPIGQLKLTYNDKSIEYVDITTEMVTKFSTSVAGAGLVELTYNGLKVTHVINVEEFKKVATSLEILVNSDVKLKYKVGESFYPSGEIRVNYNDGSHEIVPITATMVSKFSTASVGDSLVELAYEGCTIVYAITVVEDVVEEEPTLTPVEIEVSLDTSNNKVVKAKVHVEGDFKYIELPSGQKVYKNDFTYSIRQAGTYVFNVVGKDGVSVDSHVLDIEEFDNEAPIIAFSKATTSSALQVTIIDDNYSHTITPNGERIEEDKFEYDINKGLGTFIAFDRFGNKSTKDYMIEKQVVIGESSKSTTFVHVAGNPLQWTNKDVELLVLAVNEEDGVNSVVFGTKGINMLADAIEVIASADTLVNTNGDLEYTIVTPYGTYTDSIKIDKIDKDAPTLAVETDGNIVNYVVADTLSGVAKIYLPTGEILEVNGVESKTGSFVVNADGDFDIIVEDLAGNTTTKTFSVVYDETYVEPSDDEIETPDDDTVIEPSNPDEGTDADGNEKPSIPDEDNGEIVEPSNPDNGNDSEDSVEPSNPDNDDESDGGIIAPPNNDSMNKPDGGSGSDNSTDYDDDDFIPNTGNNSTDSSSNSNGTIYNKEELDTILKALVEKIPFTLQLGLVDLSKFTDKEVGAIKVTVTEGKNTIDLVIGDTKLSTTLEGVPVVGKATEYKDVKEKHWAYKDIQKTTELGVLQGVGEGVYNPKATLNFADAFTGINKLLLSKGMPGITLDRATVIDAMKELNSEHWAYNNVANILARLDKQYMLDLLSANEDFYVAGITRGEVAKVIYELTKDLNIPATLQMVMYSDMKEVPDYISYVTRTRIMVGDTRNKFNQNKTLTRAELATILSRLNNLLSE